MGHENQHESNLDTRFEWREFSPKIQEAIVSLTDRLLTEAYPVDRICTSRFFRVPETLIEDKHVEYFKAYVAIAIRQLVVGGFYGPNYDISGKTEDEQVKMIMRGGTTRLFTDRRIQHDIAHTVVALGRSHDDTKHTSLIPDFQRKTQNRSDYRSEKERIQAINMMHVDEDLAIFWSEFGNRDGILSSIRSAKSDHTNEEGVVDMKKAEQAFVSARLDLDYLSRSTKVDSFSKNLMKRVFHEYENNEMLTFDIFQEITMPLMKREARGVAKAFR